MDYEKLILCAGSHPYIPAMQGIELDGVFTLRTADDADEILYRARKGASIVGIGGGILGMECAGALGRQAADIVLLESHSCGQSSASFAERYFCGRRHRRTQRHPLRLLGGVPISRRHCRHERPRN